MFFKIQLRSFVWYGDDSFVKRTFVNVFHCYTIAVHCIDGRAKQEQSFCEMAIIP